MKRIVKTFFKQQLLFLHKLGTRFGIHILPVHYYSPMPDIVALEKKKSQWAYKSELPGIDINLNKQIEDLQSICLPYQREYANNEAYKYAVEKAFGPGFGYIEAQALHGAIRHFKPKRIVEIGSGVSSWCMLNAIEKNKFDTGYNCELTCIDPNPTQNTKNLIGSKINLIPVQAQSVPFEKAFSHLEKNDLLFIDSSHTVKPGSDVNYLCLEILPRLKPGVIVHIHDIFLPFDYTRDVLQTYFHWTETSLVRAFLTHNPKARIIFCLSHLHYERQNELAKIFPEYNPQKDKDGLIDSIYKPFTLPPKEHFPSSLYIQIQ